MTNHPLPGSDQPVATAPRRVPSKNSTPSQTKPFIPKKRAADTAEQLFRQIVEWIVDGHWRPGTIIRESNLATELGVSRTPVREAIRRASAMGLVELTPNHRPRVRSLQARDILGLYEVRTLLEIHALREYRQHAKVADLDAVARAIDALRKLPDDDPSFSAKALALDDRFHNLWLQNCGNPWIAFSAGQIWTFIRIFQRIVARDTRLAREALLDHAKIGEALLRNDWKKGEQLLRNHLSLSTDYVRLLLETAR